MSNLDNDLETIHLGINSGDIGGSKFKRMIKNAFKNAGYIKATYVSTTTGSIQITPLTKKDRVTPEEFLQPLSLPDKEDQMLVMVEVRDDVL